MHFVSVGDLKEEVHIPNAFLGFTCDMILPCWDDMQKIDTFIKTATNLLSVHSWLEDLIFTIQTFFVEDDIR